MLQENFYNTYVNSGAVIKSHRVCSLEAIVVAEGEKVRPLLTYLPGLADLLGWIGAYIESWVKEFYASLCINPDHRFIHFSFRGCDHRLYSTRARELLRPTESPSLLHYDYYRDTEPPRCPHGREVPPIETVRVCFCEPFREGSSRLP